MARSTGLAPRRGYTIDAATVLVGAVAAGARGRAAEIRTGAARLLNTRLEAQDVFKVVVNGQSADAAGGYIIEAAHVAEGAALASASDWTPIATAICSPGVTEIPLSGATVRELVRTQPATDLTGDIRVVAIRATAGTKTGQVAGNGVLVPVGANTISLQYA